MLERKRPRVCSSGRSSYRIFPPAPSGGCPQPAILATLTRSPPSLGLGHKFRFKQTRELLSCVGFSLCSRLGGRALKASSCLLQPWAALRQRSLTSAPVRPEGALQHRSLTAPLKATGALPLPPTGLLYSLLPQHRAKPYKIWLDTVRTPLAVSVFFSFQWFSLEQAQLTCAEPLYPAGCALPLGAEIQQMHKAQSPVVGSAVTAWFASAI